MSFLVACWSVCVCLKSQIWNFLQRFFMKYHSNIPSIHSWSQRLISYHYHYYVCIYPWTNPEPIINYSTPSKKTIRKQIATNLVVPHLADILWVLAEKCNSFCLSFSFFSFFSSSFTSASASLLSWSPLPALDAAWTRSSECCNNHAWTQTPYRQLQMLWTWTPYRQLRILWATPGPEHMPKRMPDTSARKNVRKNVRMRARLPNRISEHMADAI